MKLFAGLGNPGRQYSRNRHNIGYMAIDRIADEYNFSSWRGKFLGAISEGRVGSEKVVLLKPETFMNRSGQSVGEAMRYFKCEPGDVTVFHDEIDLLPGKVKTKLGGGHAGHNGLRSLHQHIGPEFVRVRLGVGHPGRKELVSGFVLSNFGSSDEEWLSDVLDAVSAAATELAAGNLPAFSNAVALRLATTDETCRPPIESSVKKTENDSIFQKLATLFRKDNS
ncbi:MAG: aminoacyl-tRNA hydrolase [Albidovulum sp.]|nr:aminoacyl-tRNA hydrolase [Albidovulum sp.]MDE0533224.1 aminoacyl-tRNA hydrolase [Albidovulum sp.]